jgi:TDG/mug DNA glycosylase family protein
MKKEFDRFYGVTEEELHDKRLDDVIDYNLDIVFVNINPGLYSVYKGHHYSGPGNHFWRCISESGLTNHVLKSSDDYKMLDYRMGLVNMFEKYNKKSCQDMSVEEIKEAQANLDKKIKLYKPKIVAFNGKSIYEIYMGASANNKDFNFGKQPTRFANGSTDAFMFVMPSSSARCSQLPRIIDKVPFYTALKKLKDFLRGYLSELNDLDITFPDFKVALDSGADTSELKKGHDSDSSENESDDLNSTATNAHRIKFVRLNNLPYSQIPSDVLENLRAQRTSKKSVTITTTKDYFKSASRVKVEEKRFAGSSACSDLDSVSTATNDSSDFAELDQQQASATSKIGSLILNICSSGKPEAKIVKLNSPAAHSPQVQPKPVNQTGLGNN